MERNKIFKFIEENHFKKGGTKEACTIAYDYLHYAATIGSSIIAYESGIRNDEFLDAVKVLLAAVCNQEDTVPEGWLCENDCVYSPNENCLGLAGINKESSRTCPFYCVEDK